VFVFWLLAQSYYGERTMRSRLAALGALSPAPLDDGEHRGGERKD